MSVQRPVEGNLYWALLFSGGWMLTIQDALTQRLPRVRKPNWANPQAYLRLPLFANGYGPWAELYDDVIQQTVLEVRPGSQRLLTFFILQDDDYVPYSGPASPFESHAENYASIYAEC